MITIKSAVCPLCGTKDNIKQLEGPDERFYRLCPECFLIFVDDVDMLPAEDEKERYLEHNNGIQYPGYVKFLSQAVEPALPLLKKGDKGLDFGCGPVPTLSILVERQGYKCDDYDPFFVPEKPKGPYDFIFSTECFEHFYHPAKEMDYLGTLLKPNGLLIIMTLFWKEEGDLLANFYFRDPSHVVFYHPETIEWLANRYGFVIEHTDDERVAILRKS